MVAETEAAALLMDEIRAGAKAAYETANF